MKQLSLILILVNLAGITFMSAAEPAHSSAGWYMNFDQGNQPSNSPPQNIQQPNNVYYFYPYPNYYYPYYNPYPNYSPYPPNYYDPYAQPQNSFPYNPV